MRHSLHTTLTAMQSSNREVCSQQSPEHEEQWLGTPPLEKALPRREASFNGQKTLFFVDFVFYE